MTVLRMVVVISFLAFTASGQQSSSQQPPVQRQFVSPASCPVTVAPADPFMPPAQYELDNNSFWLGTEKLWTVLRKSGIWEWAPHKSGHEHDVQPLTEKTFWMSVNFHWAKEWPPALKVTGKRLDGFAPSLLTMPATNAFTGPAAAMLTGVYVPTPGCWKITGEYRGQKLSFVVWVKQRHE